MLPEDIQDLEIAFVLVVLLVIVGSAFQISDFNKKEEGYKYESKSLDVRDEEKVFFLNLLKTKAEDKTIADLIILSEDNKDLLKDVKLKDVKDEIKDVMDFYGKSEDEYGLRIIYPNNNIENFGCAYQLESNGIVQKLPSLSNGIIELQFSFHGGECVEYWL